jgi:hypothetical protein
VFFCRDIDLGFVSPTTDVRARCPSPLRRTSDALALGDPIARIVVKIDIIRIMFTYGRY